MKRLRRHSGSLLRAGRLASAPRCPRRRRAEARHRRRRRARRSGAHARRDAGPRRARADRSRAGRARCRRREQAKQVLSSSTARRPTRRPARRSRRCPPTPRTSSSTTGCAARSRPALAAFALASPDRGERVKALAVAREGSAERRSRRCWTPRSRARPIANLKARLGSCRPPRRSPATTARASSTRSARSRESRSASTRLLLLPFVEKNPDGSFKESDAELRTAAQSRDRVDRRAASARSALARLGVLRHQPRQRAPARRARASRSPTG